MGTYEQVRHEARKSGLEIASMLGARDENRAVFVKAGKAIAIVVRPDGLHPSGAFTNTRRE
jgi:hypothetical protein